jgi:hypothetical protein
VAKFGLSPGGGVDFLLQKLISGIAFFTLWAFYCLDQKTQAQKILLPTLYL